MKQLARFASWVNTNLLLLCSLALLAFIPLYPKIPLFDILPGYIVKVRIEDFLILFTGLVWLRDVIRKKIAWNTSYFWFVCFYAAAGLLSILLGIFLLQTVPFQFIHLGKTGLNYVRYLEYFTIFFFLYDSIKTKRHLYMAVVVTAITVLGIVGYGVGQKYAHFPVYSTMNREYSKGEKLYLQPGTRPQSTFAGPYDLSAYLVIVLPILFSLSLGGFTTRSKKLQLLTAVLFQIIHAMGLLMLVLSGSKTSLLGYLIGMGLVILIHISRLPTKRLKFVVTGILFALGLVIAALGWVIAPPTLKNKILGMFHKNNTTQDRPSDLVGDGYQPKLITTALPDGTYKQEYVREKSTWSPNALKYGLSMGIRLDTLWPQALLGFARNPLTGSSYGTLATLDSHGFTEADSTDNNFLRSLGETGILGVITFYGFVLYILKETWRSIHKKDPLTATLSIGFYGSIIGLLISAVSLDVFTASKVAFTFWAFSGLVLKSGQIMQTKTHVSQAFLRPIRRIRSHIVRHWPLYLSLVLGFFLLHQNPFLTHSPLQDIEHYTSGIENLVSARCYVTLGRFELCRSSGLITEPHFTLYSLLLIPFVSLFHSPGIFYYLNMLLFICACIASYIFARKKTTSQNIFTGLLVSTLATVFMGITRSPLTTLQLLFILIGFPVVARITIRVLRLPQNSPLPHLKMRAMFIILLLVSSFMLLPSNITPRFIAPQPVYTVSALQIANGIVVPPLTGKAYLISALNPYYADMYSSGNYTLLPLSSKQPYGSRFSDVWGVQPSADLNTLYSSLLPTSSLFASDANIQKDPIYTQSFESLKKNYALKYVALGCDELCNIYSVLPNLALVSTEPVSVFSSKVLHPSHLYKSYEFVVASGRPSSTATLASKLLAMQKSSLQFMVVTNPSNRKFEPVDVGALAGGFANNALYPVLFAPGNESTVPIKHVASDYQTFFSSSEYFIFLDTDSQSHITEAQKLKLYSSFLELEKMPNIKTVFIISHDLNWQDRSDPGNALFAIERKMKLFHSVHTVVITANHSSTQSVKPTSFDYLEDRSTNVSYAASLITLDPSDTYTHVTINNGNVTIQGEKLP